MDPFERRLAEPPPHVEPDPDYQPERLSAADHRLTAAAALTGLAIVAGLGDMAALLFADRKAFDPGLLAWCWVSLAVFALGAGLWLLIRHPRQLSSWLVMAAGVVGNSVLFLSIFGDNIRRLFGSSVNGRPFRAGERACTATPAATGGWAAPLALEAPADREELAAAWLRDAAEEHASVAAFSRLSLQLLALGAPPELVDGCHAAARDEVAHARGAYAIAAALAGRALGPAPWPEALAPAARTDLVTLAVESLRDGCLNEGFAAALAQAGAEGAVEPVRGHLARVAEDEGRHAELGWAVLAWCLERGRPEVSEAVQAELARGPVATDDAELPVGWARFGRVGGRARARAYAAVRAELRARLRGLLASPRAA